MAGSRMTRATVAATSPLTVVTRGATRPTPARLPVSPTITVSAGADVLCVRSEDEYVVLVRLS